MRDFITFHLSSGEFDRFVLLLKSDNTANMLVKIESELSKNLVNGRVLVDQILCTGENGMRFVAGNFINGKFDVRSLEGVMPEKKFYEITNRFLNDNRSYIDAANLTDEEKEHIKTYIIAN